MASTVFPSNNDESYWVENGNVRNYSVKRSQLNPISNPNPTPNVQPKQIEQIGVRSTWQANEVPRRTHLPPPRSADVTGRADQITINMGEYSRAELRELERRLRSELGHVRSFRAQIEVMGRSRKRAITSGPAREPKRAATVNTNPELDVIVKKTMTKCSQMLSRLMKHNHAWVFNKPVDVVGLGLHDYFQIIESPMDLGTVKAKLGKKEYKSPLDFAYDVKLTFKNAMKYNPKGQDVHIMADGLLGVFENMFNRAFEKFEAEKRRLGVPDIINESKCLQEVVINNQPKKLYIPDKQQQPVMSFEEKEKLGTRLQELAPDQMGPMLAILSRRNTGMAQNGDEIELDFETLDNDLLWELNSFVNELENAKKFKVDVVEEDVDIGEEIPLGDYPPLEIEKDANRSGSSGSSSSGSGSSSSGGSGSVTSSGSDSEEDSVQSPFVEPK